MYIADEKGEVIEERSYEAVLVDEDKKMVQRHKQNNRIDHIQLIVEQTLKTLLHGYCERNCMCAIIK